MLPPDVAAGHVREGSRPVRPARTRLLPRARAARAYDVDGARREQTDAVRAAADAAQGTTSSVVLGVRPQLDFLV